MVIPSAVSKIRNSPIHFIKLTKYGRSVDDESARELGKILNEKVRNTEMDRSYKGRRMLNFIGERNDEIFRKDKAVSSNPSKNIIPYGPSKSTHKYPHYKDKLGAKNEILRPDLEFISNARPAKLKWREMRIKKTPILKPYKAYTASQAYKAYRAKYRSAVPVHKGYSRAYLEPAEYSYQEPLVGSSLTRIPSASWNGQPSAILTVQYPVRESILYNEV